ncbi:bifunctional diguanylate cyclase/phosphodiesterase [Sulfurospirillum barnesii]|uniref:Diguanylate cyclase (GGDEF) domain-containing protein n=1 Tax=Sulfurospirillum barnesii (strain ATCC 700032 / DSM 10660 / SES-3) TaxID=760154 RepID=I3XWJ3_SULBS|nr:EAL domain-containing protein [Sulfurospirillum barnesii]AFL68317.1 diguanylate cyclase (GGDEF) domain-containing protein [Sulfurospirillum barnesii SES-3]
MALIQKNIWTIFYIILFSGTLFLGIASYNTWHSIDEKYATNQSNLVKLVGNATHSLFLSQEMMLDVLGKQVLKDKEPRILDDLLRLNPSVVAFGFVDVNGTYLYVNSKFDKTKLPNLRQNPLTKDSFEYTLASEKMILGNTYFIAGSGRWGIPIRKSIYDESGQILGVMTAGLGIEGAFKIYTENLSLGDYNKVTLIRERDAFVQFQSSNHKTPKEVYEAPLAESFLKAIFDGITEKYGISLETLKTNGNIYTAKIQHEANACIQIALKYDPRYELWILSQIDETQILHEFFYTFMSYVLIFLLMHGILFLLFRVIAHAENKRSNDLIFQATHDALTKLPNRAYFQQCMNDWIYQDSPPFSLLYMDLDHFKNVNDSFGHHFGDLVLIEFSKRILHVKSENSVVIRQGGDEFILLSYLVKDDELLAQAEKIMQEISKPYHIKQFNFVIGASIGIAKYPEHGKTLDMLLRASDIAMYEAKKYKNSVRFFASSMQEGYLNRVSLEQTLRQALNKQELYMVYQPQMDHYGVMYGVEALVRWQSEELGLVPPDKFIPVAEASGLMPKLGDFIMRRTLEEMKTFQEEMGTSFQVSLNISIKQFMEATFLEKLTHEIENVRLSNLVLCLEITESLFIEDIDYLLPLLQKIRAMGLYISMDDFGTGYSSLSILRKLPVDELKIDKSFVDTLLEDITAEKMVQNIITIGKNLDLAILAEGVETKEQEEKLKSLGCDRFQGYLYAKPLPYEALKSFVQAQK